MKYLVYRFVTLMILAILLPFFILLFFIIKLTSRGPFLFKQKRMGKNKRTFSMYKIRTMVENAEKVKDKYLKDNEVDGPVFKIRQDPRYTKIGKLLSHTGLDELPQLINVLKGEMSFVGPRPLPIAEALKVPKKYEARFSVLPGITSLWIIKGAHKLNFKQWMDLDLIYIKKTTFKFDLIIIFNTILLVLKLILNKILKRHQW